jgi:hypothetical protein
VQFGIATPFPFSSFGPQLARMMLLAETTPLQNISGVGPEKPLFTMSAVTITNKAK